MNRLWGTEERPGWLFSFFWVLVSSAVAGIGIWTYLYAEWAPLQRYYWNEYLNTEMFRGGRGEYRVLEKVDRQGQHEFAAESDVVATARRGQIIPFVLSTSARQGGAADLVVGTVHFDSAQMHRKLAQSIYNDQSATELSWPAWGGALGVFVLGLGWAVRRNLGRPGSVEDGMRLNGKKTRPAGRQGV